MSERALQKAGVIGSLPTPLDVVAESAGIVEIIDVSELPDDLIAKMPSAWRRVLGALLYRERVAFVDRSLRESRARFVQGHETGHQIIPWHRRSYELDEERGLFRETKETLDIEANLAAAHLIFQGYRFHEQAYDFRLSIDAPIALASYYGASLHAAIRYFVEHHADPVGLLIAGRYKHSDGSLPIWHCIESPPFRARFGPLAARFSDKKLSSSLHHDQTIGDLACGALTASTVNSMILNTRDLVGERHQFVAEAFFNFRCVFVMLTPREAAQWRRRIRLRAS